MLVLSRRVGEKIEIGDGITVTVLKVTGKSVRLGIEAPKHVTIRRSEIELDQRLGISPLPATGSSTINASSETPA